MSETVIVKNTVKVSSIGIEGSVSTSAFWADTVYADSDKWTSATPLHPDIGAVQDRTAPGRRFGAGGGTL